MSDRVIFRQSFLHGIRDGSITLAFRCWRRPTVRTGGTLLTAVGLLHISRVFEVTETEISDADARRAGYPSRGALLAELNERREGRLYRIELGPLRPDPRVALRESAPTDADVESLVERLQRLDSRAADGPWTRRTLELIRAHPGVRAGDLAARAGQETMRFKTGVRTLKSLGLTESLEIGYRLSARGRAFVEATRRP